MAEETQGPEPHLPQGAARRPGHHRRRSTCWCRSRRSRWCRPSSSAKARRRCSRWCRPARRAFRSAIFGFITMFAVANSALINMLMASRLVYGMSREHVLPRGARQGACNAAHALHRHRLHHAAGLRADHLRRRGAGAGRHHRAAAAVRVHRGQRRRAGAAQGHGRPQALPHADASCRCSARCRCAFLVGPWTGRDPRAVRDRRRC